MNQENIDIINKYQLKLSRGSDTSTFSRVSSSNGGTLMTFDILFIYGNLLIYYKVVTVKGFTN